ncbi:hypothetical protein MY5147_007915 [Beauveria neobassiana]
MSHLARVNRWLYQVLDPILYMMDAKPYNQYALFWAAEHNLLTVAERALRAGTPVQPHNDVPSPLRGYEVLEFLTPHYTARHRRRGRTLRNRGSAAARPEAD